MWRLFALFFLASAITCPIFHCSDTESLVCGSLASPEDILIRRSPCPSGLECSAVQLYSWYWNLTQLRLGDQYNCTLPKNQTTLPSSIPSLKWLCPDKRSQVRLLSGSHPKACNTDDDCQLNSPYVRNPGCKCSLMQNSTHGFCQPLLDEEIFNVYWAKCDDEGFVHGEEAVYWFLTFNYYVYYLSDLQCTNVLWEFAARDFVSALAGMIPYMFLTCFIGLL